MLSQLYLTLAIKSRLLMATKVRTEYGVSLTQLPYSQLDIQ
jgi:hypothetical protein